MRIFIAALLIIFLSTFTAVADAQVPHHMTISGKDWLIADGLNSSTILVTVFDAAGNPLPAATVTFSGASPWTLSSTSGVTDALGRYSTAFQPTTKSGSALITVNASAFEGGVLHSIEDTYTQTIDHGTPMTAVPTYDLNISVGMTTIIQVKVTDTHGNPVDNRNVVETVDFAASGTTDSAFWDGSAYVKLYSAPVDSEGIARATFLVTKAGANFVDIQPPSPVTHRLITVTGVNDGSPYAITQAVSPGGYPYPYVRTDGSKFRIVYTILDQYGNPAGNRAIHLVTSIPGEETTYTSNSNGIVAFYYQKDAAGLYTLTATAVDNASVTTTLTVEFIAADPTTMLLTASPQTMPSRDVRDTIFSTLFAKVIDAKGNPVSGEQVSFTIWSYNVGTFNQTVNPSIENDSVSTDIPRETVEVVTDTDGLARVTFRPGGFTRDKTDPLYSYTAQGSAVVEARWRTVSHNIDLQYKNYPFLSVDALAEPKTLVVNQSVNITIRLKGDGWALQQKPIDVVLVTDRSGSMLFNSTVDTSGDPDVINSESPHDRMVMAMDAAKIFVDQMNSTDRIGLVSFADLETTNGWAVLYDVGSPNLYGYHWRSGRDFRINSYGNWVEYHTDDMSYVTTHYAGHGGSGKYYGLNLSSRDLSLSYDKTTVKNIIDRMVPTGGTPMRYGLHEAVTLMATDPEITAGKRDDAVRAIVLLTDGAWNTGGDPRGGAGADWLTGIGTGSVITWAKDHDIRIYTIALGSEPYEDQLQAYADETGGKAYIAASGLDLQGIYTAIAGDLHTQAGVGTTMDLSFHDVEVNGALIPGLDALKYNCSYPTSTHEFSYNLTFPPSNPILDRFYDQTADWDADQSLHFDVGTIFIGGVWEANFSMKVLREGNIKILDSNSSIKFNDGSALPLPDTYITARPDNPGAGPMGIGIWVTDVRRSDSGADPDFVEISWNLTYTGLEPTIQERVEIQQVGTTGWSTRLLRTIDSTTTKDSMTLDISTLPSGTWYVRVTAAAADAGENAGVTQFIIQKVERTPRIKIL